MAIANWLWVAPTTWIMIRGAHASWRDLAAAFARPTFACLGAIAAIAYLLPANTLDEHFIDHLTALIQAAAIFAVLNLAIWLAIPGGIREIRAIREVLRNQPTNEEEEPSANTEP